MQCSPEVERVDTKSMDFPSRIRINGTARDRGFDFRIHEYPHGDLPRPRTTKSPADAGGAGRRDNLHQVRPGNR